MNLKSHFHFITFFIIVNILLLFSQTPAFIRLSKTPPDRIFTFVHTDWAHDYYLYLSVITQGANGSWLYRDPYTTETTNPGIFYIFFTAIGQISRPLHLSPILTYHLITISGFELFIILIFLLSQKILGNKGAFWAGLLSIAGTISPALMANLKIAFPTGMPWFIMMDALERLYILPHYVFSETLLVLGVLLFIEFIEAKKYKYALLSAISIFLGGFILPSVLIFAVFVLPIFAVFNTAIKTLGKKKVTLSPILMKGIVIILFFAAIDYMMMKYQTGLGFPWNQWIKWNVARWNLYEPTYDKIFLLSFGILPVLSLPSIYLAFRKKNWALILISLWAIVPFCLLPFATPFEIAKIRLTQMANFVPFGILASYTIFKVIPQIISARQYEIFADRIRDACIRSYQVLSIKYYVLRIIKRTLYNLPILRARKFHMRAEIIVIFIFLLSTLPVSFNILSQRIRYVVNEPIYDHIFLPKTSYETVSYIKGNILKNSVILAHEKMGIIIPAFAPVISYFGHTTQTMNYAEKEKNVKDFFSGKLTKTTVLKFLHENNIKYIYYGWQEKELGDIKGYTFLKPVYKNENVVLYRVE